MKAEDDRTLVFSSDTTSGTLRLMGWDNHPGLCATGRIVVVLIVSMEAEAEPRTSLLRPAGLNPPPAL